MTSSVRGCALQEIILSPCFRNFLFRLYPAALENAEKYTPKRTNTLENDEIAAHSNKILLLTNGSIKIAFSSGVRKRRWKRYPVGRGHSVHQICFLPP